MALCRLINTITLAALTLILTATPPPAAATAQNTPGDALFRSAKDVLELPYASLIAAPSASLVGRAATTATVKASAQPSAFMSADDSSTPLNKDGSLNVAAWDNATETACRAVLAGLRQSTNPSGTCICYNVPALDLARGVFSADLRLFRVSPPRAEFAAVAQTAISVAVSYAGASVMAVAPGEMGLNNDGELRRRMNGPDGSGPDILRRYSFVGRIDAAQMSGNMTMAKLQSLIMPTLTLSAQNSTGAPITTTVSLNEASFLTGVFSRDIVQSDFSAAQAAVKEQVAGLANGTVAFVLPGVRLLIFPTGLVLTGLWLLIGAAAVGFGTYERWQHAEAYRRRKKALDTRPVQTL